MSFIKDAIVEASNTSGCTLELRTEEESKVIRNCIEEKYASNSGVLSLWERLEGEASRYDPDGWKAIGQFPCDDMVTIFFDREDEVVMYRVKSCLDLVKLLSECPGFVFYLTDDKCSFLLCHNDHDYLIGAGSAKDWVRVR